MSGEITQPHQGPSAAAAAGVQHAAPAPGTAAAVLNKAVGAQKMGNLAGHNPKVVIPGKPLQPAKKSEGRKNAESREASKERALEKAKQQATGRKAESDNLSNGFAQRDQNVEYQLLQEALSKLAQEIKFTEKEFGLIDDRIDPEELIKLVNKELSVQNRADVSQVDKTFEFLLEVTREKLDTSTGQQYTHLEKVYKNISTAKVRHYERFAADIEAAEGLKGVANKILGEYKTVAEAMDYLREKINNPQTAHEIFEGFMSRGLKFKDLEKEVKMSLKLKGAMTKQKQENPYLQQLLAQIKTEQAIFGVYAQSNKEFNSMYTYLDKGLGLFQ